MSVRSLAWMALLFVSVVLLGVCAYLVGRRDGRILTTRRIANEVNTYNRLTRFSAN